MCSLEENTCYIYDNFTYLETQSIFNIPYVDYRFSALPPMLQYYLCFGVPLITCILTLYYTCKGCARSKTNFSVVCTTCSARIQDTKNSCSIDQNYFCNIVHMTNYLHTRNLAMHTIMLQK